MEEKHPFLLRKKGKDDLPLAFPSPNTNYLNWKRFIYKQRKILLKKNPHWRMYLLILERGRETQRDREREKTWMSCFPYASQTCNLGTCPDQKSNPQPFGAQDDTPPN